MGTNCELETCTSESDSVKSVKTLLIDWSEFARKQSDLHNISWSHFRKWNIISSVTSISLTSIAGMSTIIAAQYPINCRNTHETSIPLIVIGALGISGGIAMGINKLMRFSDLSTEHDIYSDSYEIMYNDINMNLTLNRFSNHNMFNGNDEFIKFTKFKLDRLIDKAPPILETIKKYYDTKYKEKQHARPYRVSLEFKDLNQDNTSL